MSRQPNGPRGNLGWLVLIGSLSLMWPIGMDMFLPSLPTISTSLDAEVATTQLTATAFLFGIAAGQFFGGPTSDLIGRRKPLISGLAIFGVAMMLGSLAPSIAVLIACRAAAGIGAGVVAVAANAVVRDRYSGVGATKTFSQLMLLSGMSPIVVSILGAQLVGFAGWRVLTAAIGLIGIAVLVSTFWNYPETLVRRASDQAWIPRLRADASTLVRDRDFVGYALVLAFASGAGFAATVGSSFVMQQQFGVSVQLFGVVLAIAGVGIVLGSQFGARRAHVYGPRRLTIGGLVLMQLAAVVVLLALVMPAPLAFLIVGMFILATSIGLILPGTRSLAPHHHAARAGSAFAILGLVQFVASGVAAPISGLLPMSRLASMVAVVTAFALCAAGAVLITSKGDAGLPPAT